MEQKMDGQSPPRGASELRRLIDGELTEQEFRDLERRLETDEALRAQYVRYIDVEASLAEALDQFAPAAFPETQPPRGETAQPLVSSGFRTEPTEEQCPGPSAMDRAGQSRVRTWGLVAVSAACLVMAAFFLWSNGPGPGANGMARSHFAESPLRGHKHVAIVTHIDGVFSDDQGAPLRPGLRLKPGVLSLASGQLQLEFLNGAQLVLDAPAELHILAVDSATLIAGRAAARVPDSARGFVLNAPDAAIVDLGTEFAVNIDDFGRSEVHVIDGEVEVSLLGDDGSTLTSERLNEDSSLRVHSQHAALETIEGAVAPALSIRDLPASALPVTDRYYDSVLESRPFLYWRFDRTEAGAVPNEVAPEWSARLQGEGDSDGLAFDNGAARFRPGTSARFVGPDESLVDFNRDEYSIELWVNPDRLHWATIVAVIPEGDVWSRYHLNVIELAHRTTLVHTPGSFRFLHRHPPNRTGGVNLFSHEGCTPGQWHHLVAVKTSDELRLYLNGRLSRHLDGLQDASGDLHYRLVLGQLRENSDERQFAGSIDEFALYRRALTDGEVRAHYHAMFPSGKK